MLKRFTSWIATRGAIAAVVAVTLLVGGVGTARADDGGLVDDFSYESPTFGFRVEWDQTWQPLPDGTRSEDGVDGLTLAAFDGILQINASGLGVTPWEMIRPYADPPAGSVFAEFEIVEQGEADGTHFVLLEGELDGVVWRFYTEVREITAPGNDGPVLIATSLIMTEASFADSAAAAAAVELDGEPILVVLEADADADRDRDDDDSGNRGNNTLDHERDPRHDEDDDDHEK